MTERKAFSVELQKSALKQMRHFPIVVQQRIYKRLKTLATDPIPSDAKAIKDCKGYFRVRTGDYRIIYKVEHHVCIVVVIKIGHRKNVYRDL